MLMNVVNLLYTIRDSSGKTKWHLNLLDVIAICIYAVLSFYNSVYPILSNKNEPSIIVFGLNFIVLFRLFIRNFAKTQTTYLNNTLEIKNAVYLIKAILQLFVLLIFIIFIVIHFVSGLPAISIWFSLCATAVWGITTIDNLINVWESLHDVETNPIIIQGKGA